MYSFTASHPVVPGVDQEIVYPDHAGHCLGLVLKTATWPEGKQPSTPAQTAPSCHLGHIRPLWMWTDASFPFAGVLKFARLVKSYEAQDPEIASLSGKLKALFLPPMTLPPHGPASGGSVAAS